MTREQIIAMKPGRELDALVADMLGTSYVVGVGCLDLPRYSTDMAAAWEVVEKILSQEKCKWSFGMEYSNIVDWCADFTPRVNHINARNYEAHRCQAATAPEVICKAALLAML